MLDPKKLLLKNTDAKIGRRVYLKPGRGLLKQLGYARIILKKGSKPVALRSDRRETALVCVSGQARISLDGVSATLRSFDSAYIARGSRCEITALDDVDLIEGSADAARTTKSVVIPFESIQSDPRQVIKRQVDAAHRTVYVTGGDNIDANRLIFGLAMARPGHWTSWPPYARKDYEEIHAFFAMPKPAFAVQVVYEDPKKMHSFIAQEGDVVILPSGFHPTVACPAGSVNVVWFIASRGARPERGDWGNVKFQDGFSAASPPSALR